MIVLKNVIYVCSEDGLPIRAHLLRLIDIGVLPSRAIIWKNEETASSRDFISKIKIAFPYFLKIYRVIKSIYKAESKGDVDYSINIFGKNIFSLSNKPEKILKRSNIPFKVICSKSINDKRLIDEINNTNGYYVVVAKAGGILKESILSINKKFINIHKGYLPDFKGSSPTNWSILCRGKYGATAHFIDKGIDTGAIIKRKTFPPPLVNSEKQVQLYQSYIVSDVLSEVMMKCHNNGEIESTHQDTSKGKSYYRPHSLLVDISLSSQLKIKNKYNTSQKKLDSFIVKIQNILVNHNKNPDDFGKMITGLKCKVDVLFKHDIEKRIYSYCVSLKTNPSEIKNEVVLFLNDFQKQIDIGWNEKHGVKSTSQIYLLNFISLALLMHLYITVSDILDDVRLLNSACKIFDNIYSYETNKIKDLELSFICVALLEQSRSLGSLRRKIVV